MSNHRRRLVSSRFPDLTLALGAFVMAALPLCASTPNFNVPDDVALRIRLDDTLTSADSEVGDPFSATVVDQGDYQGARVYGHIAEIDISGRIKGHASMMLRLDRLVMPDGRRAPIHAEIVEDHYEPDQSLRRETARRHSWHAFPWSGSTRGRCVHAPAPATRRDWRD